MDWFGVRGSGFRVRRFGVPGSGFRVSDWFRVPGSGFRVAVLAVVLCVCSLPVRVLVSSQDAQQAPVFRSNARLTIVDVTVTDKQGRPVEGLTADDFTVTEDGDPQSIQLVAFQRVETSTDPAPPASPAASSRRPRRLPPSNPRSARHRPAMSDTATGDCSFCTST